MSTPAPDPAALEARVYRLDVIMGSCAAVAVALLGLCGVLAKKSRPARCKLWCMALSWGSAPPSPVANIADVSVAVARPPAPLPTTHEYVV